MIHFHIPGFYHQNHINLLLLGLMEKYENCFRENVAVGSVYDSFPGAIWNGGRIALGSTRREEIVRVLHDFNSRGIPCRFTFTNPLLEKKHLDDTYCNLIMELGHNGLNQVLVNSPILEEYIRRSYPKYPVISSTTKGLQTKAEVVAEAAKNYELVVLDKGFNNTEEIFEFENKERYELLINSYCQDNCPHSQEHYEAVGRCQLQFSSSDFDECKYINRDFYGLMQNTSFITAEDLYGRYAEAGFQHFKIDGRAFNRYKLIESYMYYLVRPEARDVTRLALLRASDCF